MKEERVTGQERSRQRAGEERKRIEGWRRRGKRKEERVGEKKKKVGGG